MGSAGGCGVLGAACSFSEIFSFALAIIEASGNFRGVRADNGAATAANQNDQHDFRMGLIGVRNKPSEAAAESFIVAGASLAESFAHRLGRNFVSRSRTSAAANIPSRRSGSRGAMSS